MLVFIDEKNQDDQAIYNLVDGQQRLSTIILIAAVAKDVISEKQKDPEIKQADSQILTTIKANFDEYIYKSSRPFGEKSPKLEPNNTDKDLFYLLVLEEGSLEEKRQQIIDKHGKVSLRKNILRPINIYMNTLQKNLKL